MAFNFKSKEEQKHEEMVEELVPPTSVDIYKSISLQAQEELARPGGSLFWSGVTAGIALATSVLAKAMLHMHLVDTEGGILLSHFGYSVGFLVVILGRMQLFTENTITPVLPLLSNPSKSSFLLTARIWGIVFFANILGAMFSALLAAFTGILSPEQVEAIIEISMVVKEHTFKESLLRGIPAGLFIAMIVWMLPSSKGFEIWIIVFITFLISLGEFSHVIAGSVEAFVLLFKGIATVKEALWEFMLPSLIGNILGGTGLFTLLTYARVKEEINGDK